MCPCESVVLDMATPWGYGRGLGTGVWGCCGGGGWEKVLGLVQGSAQGLSPPGAARHALSYTIP